MSDSPTTADPTREKGALVDVHALLNSARDVCNILEAHTTAQGYSLLVAVQACIDQALLAAEAGGAME